MRLVVRALQVFIFFTLFAFALNNEQDAVVHWFFGAQWKAPMVIVVLAAFAAGAALGVLAMVPSWWRHRRVARRHAEVPTPVAAAPTPPPVAAAAAELPPEPSRIGL